LQPDNVLGALGRR